MGVLDGLVRKDAAGAAFPSQGFLPTLGATPSATGLLISQGTAMAVSTVYACVTRRSQDFARCRPRLMRELEDGSLEEVLDHPVAELLRRPNRAQTWFEFAEQMNAAYLLRGNAYAAIKRDDRGRVTELIPINPDGVLVLESSNGEIFYNVNRIGLWQTAMLREFPSSLAAEDMFHLRGLSFNALVALSTIGMARDSIGVAMGLEQQAARWMKNGARPAVALQSKKPLTEPTAKRLKRQFDDVAAGLQNTGNTVVLEDGIEAKELQLKSVDLEFIKQREFTVADIARFWGVPLFKLGITELRGVNLVQVDQDYVNNTIMPDLDRWTQKLGFTFDLDREGLEVSFDETELLRADIQTRYNIGRLGVLSGLLKPNEFRRGERLPLDPNGDKLLAPVNLAALGSDMTGTAPDGAGRPHDGDLPDGGVPNQHVN